MCSRNTFRAPCIACDCGPKSQTCSIKTMLIARPMVPILPMLFRCASPDAWLQCRWCPSSRIGNPGGSGPPVKGKATYSSMNCFSFHRMTCGVRNLAGDRDKASKADSAMPALFVYSARYASFDQRDMPFASLSRPSGWNRPPQLMKRVSLCKPTGIVLPCSILQAEVSVWLMPICQIPSSGVNSSKSCSAQLPSPPSQMKVMSAEW